LGTLLRERLSPKKKLLRETCVTPRSKNLATYGRGIFAWDGDGFLLNRTVATSSYVGRTLFLSQIFLNRWFGGDLAKKEDAEEKKSLRGKKIKEDLTPSPPQHTKST
jgi:hypothetical protein